MNRGGKPAVLQAIDDAIASDELKLFFCDEMLAGGCPFAELLEVYAAPHIDVLAVVDQFACCLIDDRSCTPAKPWS